MTSKSNWFPRETSIPKSWQLVPLKYITGLHNGYAFKSDTWEDSGTPILRIENLNGSVQFNYSSISLSERYHVSQDDLLFSWSGNPGTSFGPFIWNRPGLYYLNQHIFKVPAHGCDSKWLYWSLKAATHWIERELTSGMIGMVHVTKDELGSVLIPIPSDEEQHRIVSFLDSETTRMAKLDSLSVRILNLINQRREAILEGVIFGSNPPRQKIFRCLNLLRDGTHQPPPRTTEGVPLLTARNVSSGVVRLTDLDTLVSTDDAMVLERSLRPQAYDVLISVKGTIGAVALFPPDFPRVVLDRNLALLRPNSSILPGWLTWVLRTRSIQEQIKLSVSAAAQPGLPLGAIRELQIPLIDIDSQRRQLLAIEETDRRLGDLEAKIQTQRALLAERRQALITEAVTGQIDLTAARGLSEADGVKV